MKVGLSLTRGLDMIISWTLYDYRFMANMCQYMERC